MTLPSSPSLPTEPPGPSAPVADATREMPATVNVVNTFRGLAILEVVSHHGSGMALRYAEDGSAAQTALMILNRTLHFAVPAFLFLTALLLTRSLLRNLDLKRYYWRRLTRGAWPYLLWSALFMVWYVQLGLRPPETLSDPHKWGFYLSQGKASYHLYFLLVALEAYLALPALLWLARRRWPIWVGLGAGLALQMALYFLNRDVWRLTFPSSHVIWYALPLVTGVTVAARYDEFPAWFRRYRWWLAGLLLLAVLAYLPLAVAALRGERVPSLPYNLSAWLFTTLSAVVIYGLCLTWRGLSGGFGRVVAWFGMVSLQIYLLHPALLQLGERWWPPQGQAAAPLLTVTAFGLLALVLTAVTGHLLLKVPVLSRLLFGR